MQLSNVSWDRLAGWMDGVLDLSLIHGYTSSFCNCVLCTFFKQYHHYRAPLLDSRETFKHSTAAAVSFMLLVYSHV